LTRTFEFQGFVASLSFVNSLVAYFEIIDHHPMFGSHTVK